MENEGNELFISIASLSQLEVNSIEILSISVDHLKEVSSLPFHHRDPFDRLMIAQAKVEGFLIISVDVAFDAYGVQRAW